MSENDIIKGVASLKSIAENLRSVIEYCENNNLGDMLPFITQMQTDCGILTGIMERAFINMFIEKREEDDGK
ncbi:MAG: hypothetical protein J6S85_18430 [Methanobrevibacter sp.]|nr:hypothetical protein [Methanobrevibacter sp.]